MPKGPRVKATRNGKVPGAAERKLASPVAVVLGFRIRGNNQAGKFAFERRSPLGWEPRRPNRSPGRSRAPGRVQPRAPTPLPRPWQRILPFRVP